MDDKKIYFLADYEKTVARRTRKWPLRVREWCAITSKKCFTLDPGEVDALFEWMKTECASEPSALDYLAVEREYGMLPDDVTNEQRLQHRARANDAKLSRVCGTVMGSLIGSWFAEEIDAECSVEGTSE